MHRSELDAFALTNCVSCGVELSVERERGYALGEDSALCYACATARGGRYDERLDRWSPPPDVRGLELPAPRAV